MDEDDLIFRILCECLYQELYSYEGFSMSESDSEELEKRLMNQFRTSPEYYKSLLEKEYYAEDLIWRWENLELK